MAEEPFYMGIDDQSSVRKHVLLCSRDIITSLKNYEAYKEISSEAVETTFELRRTMEELVVLNRKLRQILPKTKLKAAESKVSKKKEAREEKGLGTKTLSKIKNLEKALDKIEGKLKGMN